MIPAFLICIMIFVVWFRYESNKSEKSYHEAHEAFLEREALANTSRKKDISELPYITVPEDIFTSHPESDDELTSHEEDMRKLAGKKILNLTGISNTDLKISYGTANFPLLSEYDKNYTELVRLLYRNGSLLLERGYRDDAKRLLKYGIEIGTDVSANYTLLASIYKEENDTEGFDYVYSSAEKLSSLTKGKLLKDLSELKP